MLLTHSVQEGNPEGGTGSCSASSLWKGFTQLCGLCEHHGDQGLARFAAK